MVEEGWHSNTALRSGSCFLHLSESHERGRQNCASNAKARIGIDRTLSRICRIRAPLGVKVGNRQRRVRPPVKGVKRAELKCQLSPFNRELSLTHPSESNGAAAKCEDI